MGDNSDIKMFRPAAPSVQRSLLDTRPDHTPTIARLLSSPWVSRGSELVTESVAATAVRANVHTAAPAASGPAPAALPADRAEPVQVDTDHRGAPRAFVRDTGTARSSRGVTAVRRVPRRYVVEHIVSYWVEDYGWFEPGSHVRRRHYRVLARPASLVAARATAGDLLTFDLVLDLRREEWSLAVGS